MSSDMHYKKDQPVQLKQSVLSKPSRVILTRHHMQQWMETLKHYRLLINLKHFTQLCITSLSQYGCKVNKQPGNGVKDADLKWLQKICEVLNIWFPLSSFDCNPHSIWRQTPLPSQNYVALYAGISWISWQWTRVLPLRLSPIFLLCGITLPSSTWHYHLSFPKMSMIRWFLIFKATYAINSANWCNQHWMI